jgi:integrase
MSRRKRVVERRHWGTGSVYAVHGGRRFVAAVRSPGMKRLTSSWSTREEAEADLPRLFTMAAERRIAPEMTVARLLTTWLDVKHATLRESSWQRYEETARLHLAGLAPIRVAELTADDIDAHLRSIAAAEDPASPATVAGALRTLRAALRLAQRRHIVRDNVAEYLDPPSVPDDEKARSLTLDEVRRILAVDTLYRPLWAVLIGCGLRRGEALGLRWSDVDMKAGTLTIAQAIRRGVTSDPKTRTGKRTVAMPAFVQAALEELPRDAVLVFHRPGSGTAIAQTTLARAWDRTLAAAKIPHTRLHNTRHTTGTMLTGLGAQLPEVMRELGHRDLRTALRYQHPGLERAAELATAMDAAIGGTK